MELAWQFGCTVTELWERMPSFEMPWWRALAQIRHEEHEQERLKAQSQSRNRFRGEGGGAGPFMGQRR